MMAAVKRTIYPIAVHMAMHVKILTAGTPDNARAANVWLIPAKKTMLWTAPNAGQKVKLNLQAHQILPNLQIPPIQIQAPMAVRPTS